MNRISMLAISMLLISCVTAPPSDVPRITSKDFPEVKLAALKGKKIQLKLHVNRKVNLEANNTSAVESSLTKSLSDALLAAGIDLDNTGLTQLEINIVDETKMKAEGQCLRIDGVLNNKKVRINASGIGCFGYKNAVFGNSMGSDVNELYKIAFGVFITGLEEQVDRYQEKF